MNTIRLFLFLLIGLGAVSKGFAQYTPAPLTTKDSVVATKHIPRKAVLRSALLPGWGQAYNKQYWKVPIVLAAVGIPIYAYIFNNTEYKKVQFAYNAQVKAAATPPDLSDLPSIDPDLKGLSLYQLQNARNQYRKNRDYATLYFFLLWGLNIVDAAVSAHLKAFDVSDKLSLRLHPQFNPMDGGAGVCLSLSFK